MCIRDRVIATGGVSPYTYRLDTGPFQDNGSFGSLSAGDYIIIVRDANNCERQIQVEITQPEEMCIRDRGIVMTTIRVSNDLFPGNVCESTIADTVTITPIPSPLFANPKTVSCSNSEETYTLTESYAYHNWKVTGGIIAARCV